MSDWNYDRLHTVQALVADLQNDMMRCLHKGEVVDVVQDRMALRLRSALQEIEKLELSQ